VLALNPGQGEPEAKIDKHAVPFASLESRLSQILQNENDRAVRLEAAGELPYGSVVSAIDACRSAGARVLLVEPGA
jgi:biopolymer transport protein ExbD